MGKKGKSSSKDKSGSSKKKKSSSSKKKKAKIPVIEFEEGISDFIFENGDKYTGQFMAHRSGLAWREGQGVYVTHDGQIYFGNWKDDRLADGENASIWYQNGDIFLGKLTKYKYKGPGTYSFANGSHLVCEFVNNKPAGDLIFIDYLGKIWYGKSGDVNARFLQEHAFSSELDWERGKSYPNPPKRSTRTSFAPSIQVSLKNADGKAEEKAEEK